MEQKKPNVFERWESNFNDKGKTANAMSLAIKSVWSMKSKAFDKSVGGASNALPFFYWFFEFLCHNWKTVLRTVTLMNSIVTRKKIIIEVFIKLIKNNFLKNFCNVWKCTNWPIVSFITFIHFLWTGVASGCSNSLRNSPVLMQQLKSWQTKLLNKYILGFMVFVGISRLPWQN